jgi:hypothetical protein
MRHERGPGKRHPGTDAQTPGRHGRCLFCCQPDQRDTLGLLDSTINSNLIPIICQPQTNPTSAPTYEDMRSMR